MCNEEFVMMNEEIHERVQAIKRSFRLLMNGVASTSMREKGLDYKLNWGVSLVMLRQQAEEMGHDYHLAIELWKENIRECKILATLLMPPEEMLPEVAELWMEQTPNVEIAEQAAFNLYQHMPTAAELAFRWIASPNELYQLCGYHVLSRLFLQGREPNERGINEFLDQSVAALASQNLSLRKAVRQSLLRFANLGLVYERMARSATKVYDLFQPLN
jgi:hypothetical protein